MIHAENGECTFEGIGYDLLDDVAQVLYFMTKMAEEERLENGEAVLSDIVASVIEVICEENPELGERCIMELIENIADVWAEYFDKEDERVEHTS